MAEFKYGGEISALWLRGAWKRGVKGLKLGFIALIH